MGNPTPTPPPYRDGPDSVSLLTTPEDYTYGDAPEITDLPPPYVASQSSSSVATGAPVRHVQPPNPWQSRPVVAGRCDYSRNVQVLETRTLSDPRYDTDPVYLEEGIRSLAREAPFPLVILVGTHRETVRRGDKKETKHITDFRIVMDLQQYLRRNFDPNDVSQMTLRTVENMEKTYRGTIRKHRAPGFKQDIEVGPPKPELNEWCHLYCASPRMLKIFRLRRVVTGFDQDYLKKRIEGLVRSTNYRGHISVTFPIENRNVDIYTSNRINHWRLRTWIRWVFYLTFLWIFTWPLLHFATRRYSIVRAEWPWSFADTHGNKSYTTVSEEQWFDKWKVGIRRLVLDRFQGEASDEVLAGVAARPEDPPMPGTVRTGHEGVDTTVNLLTQGFQVARALSQGNNLERGIQSGWGYDF